MIVLQIILAVVICMTIISLLMWDVRKEEEDDKISLPNRNKRVTGTHGITNVIRDSTQEHTKPSRAGAGH